MKYIQLHKELNRSAIPFYREIAIDFFSTIMNSWNNCIEYEPLVFTKKEIRNIIKLKDYNELSDFLLQFSKDTSAKFKVGDKEIIGNAFHFVRDLKTDEITVNINEDIRHLIFTQKDIQLMRKSKYKQKMTVSELDHYNQNKEKYKQLMLYSQAELLKISGKYAKRLYMLLIQFKNTGYFVMNYNEFKQILEIPETYKPGNVDQQVLGVITKKELENVGLTITDIKKTKIKKIIDKIEIYFVFKEKTKPTLFDYNNQIIEIEDKMETNVAELGKLSIKKLKESLKNKSILNDN